MTASVKDLPTQGWKNRGTLSIKASGDHVSTLISVNVDDQPQGQVPIHGTASGVTACLLKVRTFHRQNVAIYIYIENATQMVHFYVNEWSDGTDQPTNQSAGSAKDIVCNHMFRNAHLVSVSYIYADSFDEMLSVSAQRLAA